MFGGTCINVACLPTKSLEHSAKILSKARKYGLEFDNEKNFLLAMDRKNEMVNKLNKKNYSILNDNENVDIYIGEAKFLNNKEVKVNDNVLTAKTIVINTGSTPRRIGNYKTSEEILKLDKLPKNLLIVGAGFIGLEFASIFNNFGSNVTVYQNDNNFMPSEDEEDAIKVKENLEKRGIKFVFNKTDIDAENYDEVLVSIGRIPNISKLGLENTDIKIGERGEIIVDEYLRTNVPNIFAIGDVKGGAFFTYISLDDSRIVLEQLLKGNSTRSIKNRKYFATTTFLDPAYSRVGLNEKEAKRLNIEYEVKYMPTMSIPKAHVVEETDGFSKILIDKDENILGATLYNYEAHEMINLISLAIDNKIKYSKLKDFIFTHPTFTESLNDI